MSLPVGGERHERAREALRARLVMTPAEADEGIEAYFASLAEQGVRLIEQPVCPKCEGSGETRDGRYEVVCPRCGGSGNERMVPLAEVVAYLTSAQAQAQTKLTLGDALGLLEQRFGGGER